jgi:transcriptional regulator with XRE-family HTH domain
MKSGKQLKEIRLRLGITTREVEEQSRIIAKAECSDEFYVSNGWLTQIENRDCTPTIFKLFSLAVIYRVKYHELLHLLGVRLNKISKFQMEMGLLSTHPVTLEIYNQDQTVSFPVRLDARFCADETNLLSRLVEVWGEVPIALIQHLNIRHNQYGYIGLNDYTLYPLLRPGSFVEVGEKANRVQSFSCSWRNEYDRPIYFVELRDSYACSWCELRGTQLMLIPHPLSPCSTRQFTYGKEAEVIGRVTAVAMRITDRDDLEPVMRRITKVT